MTMFSVLEVPCAITRYNENMAGSNIKEQKKHSPMSSKCGSFYDYDYYDYYYVVFVVVVVVVVVVVTGLFFLVIVTTAQASSSTLQYFPYYV